MTVNKSDIPMLIQISIHTVVLLTLLPLISAISASVRSEIEGEGFHRTLKYHVDTGDFSNKSCHIAIFLRLPTSIYVNVDELSDLRHLRMGSSCSDGEVDVERFAEKAYYQNLTLCARLTSTKTTLSVPVHQRYRFATSNGKTHNVTFSRPRLLIGCRHRIKEHRVSQIKICWPCIDYAKKWREIPINWKGDGGFIWRIPVGNTSRRSEVQYITVIVTLCGAAYVLWALSKSYRVPRERKPKDN